MKKQINHYSWILFFCSSFLTIQCNSKEQTQDEPIISPPILPLPLIQKVEPAASFAEQQVTLTLFGENFEKGANVYLCHQLASHVTFESSQKVIATFPPLPNQTSKCAVTIENPSKQQAERLDLFSFYPWQAPKLWGEPTIGGRACDLKLGDFDGDGFIDAMTIDEVSPAWIGAYLFPEVSPHSFPSDKIKNVKITDLSPYEKSDSVRAQFSDFVTGDFDEDGFLDVAAAHGGTGALWILLNNTYNIRAYFGLYSDGKYSFPGLLSGLAVADINQDQHLDLIGANSATSELLIWFGDGKGKFTQQPSLSLTDKPSQIKLLDINQDGNQDILLTSLEGNTITWFLGTSKGTFENEKTQKSCKQPRSLQIADFDQDRQLDWVMVCHDSTKAQIQFQFNAWSEVPKIQTIDIPGDASPTSLTVDDLDRNQLPDVVIGVESGGYIYALMNQFFAPGSFRPPLAIEAAFPETKKWSYPFAVQTADVNRDGFPDIIIAHKRLSSIGILLSQPPQ